MWKNSYDKNKHLTTKHWKSLKCCQCNEMFPDNHAWCVKMNVKCDKCSSNFNSKTALYQHMFPTHIPTRIEEKGMFCNRCGEEFWTELDMITHLEGLMKGSKTIEPYVCKLCGINATHQHRTVFYKRFKKSRNLEIRLIRN